ncbi:MAG TPA: hypothetical protein VHA09_06630 [Nitrososphaera sp.]|nr:hypothetical protein [Nitrososphaera sp.]
MAHAFEDDSLGLKLKGYLIVPNDALENNIAVYTLRIVQDILSDHPEIVDGWLHKIHEEYMSKKRACDFENDPVACFNLSAYEEFEKHMRSWDDGGMLAISLPGNRTLRVSKKPLFSVSKSPAESCGECRMTFATVKELVRHYRDKHPASIEHVMIPI